MYIYIYIYIYNIFILKEMETIFGPQDYKLTIRREGYSSGHDKDNTLSDIKHFTSMLVFSHVASQDMY